MKADSPSAAFGRIAKVGVVWTLVWRGFYEFVQIPASMITARLLTPEQFGVVAAANFFVQIAQRLTNFGFTTALLQRKDLADGHKSSVFVANTVIGLAMWGLLALAAPWLASAFKSQELTTILPVIGSTFFINSLASVPMALMARDLRFRENAVINGLHATVNAGLGVWLAWRGWGVWSLVWAQVAAAVVHTLVRLLTSHWQPTFRFSWGQLRDLLSFGLGLHFQRLLEAAALNIDNMVIGRLLGLSALGFYDKAFTTMNRAVVLMGSAAPAVAFRIFAIIHGDEARFRLAYRKVLLATCFAAYPVLALHIGLAPELFHLLFGPQWHMAVLPFQVLCVAGMLKTLNSMQSSVAQSTGQVWGEVRRQCLYLGLVALGAGLGSYWGLVGSSVGVLLASTAMSGLMMVFLRRVTTLAWRDLLEPQVAPIVCAFCLLTALWLLRSISMGGELAPLTALRFCAIGTLMSGVIYIGFVRYAPFEELRSVAVEIVMDLAPALEPLVRTRRRPAATEKEALR